MYEAVPARPQPKNHRVAADVAPGHESAARQPTCLGKLPVVASLNLVQLLDNTGGGTVDHEECLRIGNSIPHDAPLWPASDHAGAREQAQRSRDVLLGATNGVGEILDVDHAMAFQVVEDADTQRLTE